MINSPSVIGNQFQPKHKDNRAYEGLIISSHQSAALLNFPLASVTKLPVTKLAKATLICAFWVRLL